MKLFLSLAIIAAFATPVLANAGDISQPTTKVAAGKDKKKGKKKDKKGSKETPPADPPADGGASK